MFILVVVGVEQFLDGATNAGVGVLIDNLAFYLVLVAVLRFTAQTILWWIERIVITDKRVMIAQGIITHNVGMMPLGKVTDLVADAVANGASVAIGGQAQDGPGYFYPPTVLTDVPANSRLNHEEIFGPVAPITVVDTEQQALDAANSTEFGLVNYVYRDMLALNLPRTSRELAALQGPRITPRQLAAGDLVFFGDKGNVWHVGIYVGEGRFVHAPSAGGTVRLDRIDGPYWRDHFRGARRILR